MLDLNDLENHTIYIIRETYAEFKKPAVLWSTGKDSTAMLWLCRKAFFGKIPFNLIGKLGQIFLNPGCINPYLERIYAENKKRDSPEIDRYGG